MVTANSYFSGAGLFDIGFINAGIDVINHFELDPICCETLRLNFGGKVHNCDLQHETVLDHDSADVFIGTYPCTKYSAIADLFGNRTGDSLYLHFFRHVVLRQPEIYILENVPGMKFFKCVMEAFEKMPTYYISVFCPIDTSIFLPQKRDRLILIGSKKPFNWSAPQANKKIMLKDILEKNVIPEITVAVNNRISGKYRDLPIISDPEKSEDAPCCVAHYHKDRSTRLVKDGMIVRPYTVREYARLQGVPDHFVFCGTRNDAYKQIGNGVPVPIGEWAGREVLRYFKKAA